MDLFAYVTKKNITTSIEQSMSDADADKAKDYDKIALYIVLGLICVIGLVILRVMFRNRKKHKRLEAERIRNLPEGPQVTQVLPSTDAEL